MREGDSVRANAQEETRTLQRGRGLFLLPQQFEDSLVLRKFQGVHDENTRPAERGEVRGHGWHDQTWSITRRGETHLLETVFLLQVFSVQLFKNKWKMRTQRAKLS